jgi:plasmid stabilization system protein ParE
MAPRVRSVVWAQSAYAALDDVIAYIARDSAQAAVQVLERALSTAASLGSLSERGRIVPELADPAIREVFVHRYRLLYRIEHDRVVVVAFLHGARDFTTWRQTQGLD